MANIGDKIWRYGYRTPYIIHGETSRSWICRNEDSGDWLPPVKIPKKLPEDRYTLDSHKWELSQFARTHAYSIARKVESLGCFPIHPEDGELLRRIAEMIGWKPEGQAK